MNAVRGHILPAGIGTRVGFASGCQGIVIGDEEDLATFTGDVNAVEAEGG